jgi:hypothetical protein
MADEEYGDYKRKVQPTFRTVEFTEEEERVFKEKRERCGVDDVSKWKFRKLCGMPLEEKDVSELMAKCERRL